MSLVHCPFCDTKMPDEYAFRHFTDCALDRMRHVRVDADKKIGDRVEVNLVTPYWEKRWREKAGEVATRKLEDAPKPGRKTLRLLNSPTLPT